MEEGLSAGASLDDDLLARTAYEPYEDLLEGQTALGSPQRFFGDNPKAQRTWRPMCHLMLRRSGIREIDNAARCRYQADRLGRRDGDTLLAELLPYPNPNTKIWHYADRFATRDMMVNARVALLKRAFSDARFELVVAYGVANWQHYVRIFDVSKWTSNGSFRVGYHGDSRIVLAPHLSTRAFNTSAQLDAFADLALARA
jgi:hypothetical protein